MKKILLMGAFALFGSFAMANEISEMKEVRTEIITETAVDGSVLVITRMYGCNGELLGSFSETVPCPTCEGANIKVTSITVCFPPVVYSFPEPER